MKNLQYATIINEKHSIKVRTWEEDDKPWVKIMIDGETLSEECLVDEADEEPVSV